MPRLVANRPRFYEVDTYPWNIRRVPDTAMVGGRSIPHPAKHSAVFVVHGMGQQQWTDTASNLRSHLEDALDAIMDWEAGQARGSVPTSTIMEFAPPFVLDGYWADYEDLKQTFPEDWEKFNDRERTFFSHLWELRAYGLLRAYGWFLGQQLRLVHPRVISDVSLGSWLLYLPLQVVGLAALTFSLVRKPLILSRTLADVRIYARPSGVVERALTRGVRREQPHSCGGSCHSRAGCGPGHRQHDLHAIWFEGYGMRCNLRAHAREQSHRSW